MGVVNATYVVHAQGHKSIGKGMTTKSEVVHKSKSGAVTSIEYNEETHLDIRRKVSETHSLNKHGYLIPVRKVTTLQDRYWGSITMTETPLGENGALIVTEISTSISDGKGGRVVTSHKLNKQNDMVITSRTTTYVDENGDKVESRETLNDHSGLAETFHKLTKKGVEVELERFNNSLFNSLKLKE